MHEDIFVYTACYFLSGNKEKPFLDFGVQGRKVTGFQTVQISCERRGVESFCLASRSRRLGIIIIMI
jgi:hypothetical protein